MAEVRSRKEEAGMEGVRRKNKEVVDVDEMVSMMEEEEFGGEHTEGSGKTTMNSRMTQGGSRRGGAGAAVPLRSRWRRQAAAAAAAAEEVGGGGGVELWRPSANLSIETVNELPARVKRYYQDILGWGDALPAYAAGAMASGAAEYERLVAEYRRGGAHQPRLWQAAYVRAFCNNLRTLLRDYNRWMLQHWPIVVNHLLIQPNSDDTFHLLAETLRFMNDSSVPIREALYVFRKIRATW